MKYFISFHLNNNLSCLKVKLYVFVLKYHRKQLVTKELPEIEADALTVPDPSNVHIFAHPIDLEDEALASSKGPKVEFLCHVCMHAHTHTEK